jgi:hypothetical protein
MYGGILTGTPRVEASICQTLVVSPMNCCWVMAYTFAPSGTKTATLPVDTSPSLKGLL